MAERITLEELLQRGLHTEKESYKMVTQVKEKKIKNIEIENMGVNIKKKYFSLFKKFLPKL